MRTLKVKPLWQAEINDNVRDIIKFELSPKQSKADYTKTTLGGTTKITHSPFKVPYQSESELFMPVFKLSVILENAYMGVNLSFGADWTFRYSLFDSNLEFSTEV